MAAKVFYDPHTVEYDGNAVLGCKSISYNESDVPQTGRSDGGTVVHFVAGGGSVSGAMAFQDAISAGAIASKNAASKNVTFIVYDEAGVANTVTITKFKSGGIQGGYSGGESMVSISFVADSVSDPTP